MTAKRIAISLVLVAVVAAAGWTAGHRAVLVSAFAPPAAAVATAGPPPEVVSDMVVEARPWQDRLDSFGQIRAVQGAQLSAQVPGIVDGIAFQSGQEVRAGTVLLRLRLYDDAAKLAQLQALVSLWQANVARDQKQFQAQAISHATLDLDQANLKQYQAQVDAQNQAIEQKIVRAPFDGRLGIRQVDLGQYLPAGTPIVTLEALDPIYVDFNVVQQHVAAIAAGQVAEVSVDAYPGRVFQARVAAIDSQIDQQTRMVSVRATLGNADRALLPGMFAVVRMRTGPQRMAVAVPQASVSFNPYGDFVYVLTPAPGHPGIFVATSRVVRLGANKGDLVAVEDGLKPDETIVTAGQFKLHNNQTVTIDNRVRPADSAAPNPPEE